MTVTFAANRLDVDGHLIELDHPIEDAFQLRNLVVVLFDPDARNSPFGQFENLIAVDASGALRWVAELPTTSSGDCYYKIVSKDPLIALSNQSFDCEIDVETGKIIRKEFTK